MASKVINTILKLRDEMSGGMVKAARNTQGVSKEMVKATRNVVAFKNKASKAVTDFAKNVAKVGTGAVAAFGAYSVKVGMDFEAQMSKVAAISGASASEVQTLTDAAKKMGASTKFSATESAQALEYMAMAGWKTDQMVSGLAGIMNLAAASGEDLASVSDIVTDALTGFGLQAKDSAHFADVLAKASSSSNTNVSLMGETFKYAAPVAGALKYSIEDTAVAVGLMANAGIKGSEAGTALRGVLTNLAKPSDSVAGYMKALGVSLTDSEGNVKPLAAQMVDLRNKFAGLTDAQKAEYAAGIAGKEAMSGLLAIVNASETDFNNLTNAIAKSDGTAKAMADTMNNNLQGKITFLKSAVEGVGITFYDSIKDKASGAVQSLTDKISKWQQDGTIDMIAKKVGDGLTTFVNKGSEVVSWVVQNKDTIIGAAKAIAIAIGTIKFIKLVGDTANAIHNIGLFGKTVFTISKANLPALGTAISGAATKFGGLIKAGVSFVAANPFVLGIAAAIAIGVLLWKNWDNVKKWAVDLWNKTKEVFGGIRDSIGNAVQAARDKVSETCTGIKDSFIGAFEGAKTKVSEFFDWIDKKIESVPVLGDLYKGGKSAVGWIIDKIGGNALGTSYWQGGLTYINERGGEIVNLPNGSQVIPHDISSKMASSYGTTLAKVNMPKIATLPRKTISISVNVRVDGNIIGNKQYAKELGEEVAGEIIKKMENIA